MPGAIAAAVATATAVGTFLGFAGTVATIVGAVVIVGTVALATIAIKRKLAAQRAALSGVLVTKTGSSEPIPVVYGQRRIAGHRTFIASNGDKNKNLHIVETLCEGEIEGITKIYFNDEVVASSSDNGATWDTASYSYSGKLYVDFHNGSQTSACAPLVAENVGWTNNHIGYNVAYVYLKLVWDQDKFGSGVPNITYLVKGKRVPAIGAAPNTTLSYTREPARIIYDYLTNPLYGKAIPYTLIDSSTFDTSAAYNNQTVPVHGEARYRCDAFLDTDSSVLNNLQSLLTTCRAGMITGDKYKLIQDKPQNISNAKTIDDDNIIGNITYLQANKRTLLNSIRARFPNENDEFQYQEDIMIVDSPTLQGSSYDGVKLQQEIELSHTSNANMVERILTEEINQSRQSGILEVTVTPNMLDLTVGDVIKFTNSTLGQTNKYYRIISTVLKSEHEIVINMREYDPNVYWDNSQSIIVNNKDDTDH